MSINAFIGIIICVVIGVGIIISVSLIAKDAIDLVDHRRAACEAMHGHYINRTLDECWSIDGTRRLFPEGF